MYKGTDSKYNPYLPTQTNENPNYDIIVKSNYHLIAKQPTNSPIQTKQETWGSETTNTHISDTDTDVT